jgi:peroxiredoxin
MRQSALFAACRLRYKRTGLILQETNMTIKVGDKVPSATLMQMKGGAPQPLKTDDLFSGKKVVVFALPGAFTPTCSAKHLPGFIQHAGLEMDGSRFGMGKRSQRFSMVVDNGVVKELNVEEPGAFAVSSAEHVMKQL